MVSEPRGFVLGGSFDSLVQHMSSNSLTVTVSSHKLRFFKFLVPHTELCVFSLPRPSAKPTLGSFLFISQSMRLDPITNGLVVARLT